MASKEFVAVTWSPQQLIDEDTLDQINNNLLYLRNQSVDGTYMNLNGGLTDVGIKILCGRKIITPRASDSATVTVNFAKLFTPETIPVVTTSVTSVDGKVKIFCTISGIGQDQPSYQGFQARVNLAMDAKKRDKITKPIYVNWIAMGI